jgi:hypothetical protein
MAKSTENGPVSTNPTYSDQWHMQQGSNIAVFQPGGSRTDATDRLKPKISGNSLVFTKNCLFV